MLKVDIPCTHTHTHSRIHTQHFFHHHTALDIGSVIQEAYRLQQTTPPELHPDRMLESFVPLTRGTYPVFNRYPKFIVDYQVRERERIRQEELQYLRERYVLCPHMPWAQHSPQPGNETCKPTT